MLPTSHDPCSYHTPSKPKTPDPAVDRKNSFVPPHPCLSFHRRRTWLLLAVVLLQLFLLSPRSSPFTSRPLSTTATAVDTHPSLPIPAVTAPPAAPNAATNLSSDNTKTAVEGKPLSIETASVADDAVANGEISGGQLCPFGKVYVYDLPPEFNTEVVRNCHDLNPWTSRCEALSNKGLGRSAAAISRIMPENLAPAWFWTDQFALELIYHNRIMNYRCRTEDAEEATAYYIPFYAGLAVGKFLWTESFTAEDRDRHCDMMLNWVRNRPFWNKSDGWDHFLAMGRITWDFRRSKAGDWGSSCLYMPGMRNITRLLIERNPWDYFDVGVPYPTGFHPGSTAELHQWQEFVSTHRRSNLFCFAGANRGFIKNDFRGLLLNQCRAEPGWCRAVDCAGSKCSNGTSAILETFLDSDFCLQPRGDSFTRRSIFDCMVAGSIPVFFWKRTAYLQYQWFLPGEPGSYSVYIDRNAVKNGTSIKSVLDKIDKEKVKKMREKVIEYIPNIIYAKSGESMGGIKDAFDIAMEGVLKRVKEQEEGYKWR